MPLARSDRLAEGDDTLAGELAAAAGLQRATTVMAQRRLFPTHSPRQPVGLWTPAAARPPSGIATGSRGATVPGLPDRAKKRADVVSAV